MPKKSHMRFETFKDRQGRYRWRLLSHGENLAQSSGSYTRQSSAKRIIRSIKEWTPTADIADYKPRGY